jgi:thiopurine S-methyltransferase
LRKIICKENARIAQADGRLVGVLLNRSFEGGPPLGGSREEYEELFKEKFEIIKLEPCYNSIQPREGSEVIL